MYAYIYNCICTDRQTDVCACNDNNQKRGYQLGGKGSERVTGRGWREEREEEMLYNSISAAFKESLVL